MQRSGSGEKIIVESGEASRVLEKARAGAPGVLMAVFVKTADTVKNCRVLGHMELAPTREETEQAARRRSVGSSRVEWASKMERYHQGNYQAQLEQKKIQRLNYEYWLKQHEARFFKAPAPSR